MTDQQDITARRTFAIISHPDAGKTTVTEQLLLYGGAINLAGTVKARKSAKHATSDWMEMEKQRGISVTTSVMQFYFNDRVVNLLDTPGHADFTEDTYRTLTAVDSALMVIDCAKGVEQRTKKLMEVCRLRHTPIMTFINKMDREGRDPLELLDEVETVLGIKCAPITWPIGMAKSFQGIYHVLQDALYVFKVGEKRQDLAEVICGINTPEFKDRLGEEYYSELLDSMELIQGASEPFDASAYLEGKQTPVFFGSALRNFGVKELLEFFVENAPAPHQQPTTTRDVVATETKFSGFVFKIQANMDPAHRDRIAFLRITSGKYRKGMKMRQVRIAKTVAIHNAVTFLAGERSMAEEAFAGDIIGLHNHGTIQIGDTFTEGEDLQFIGIPHFAPELFRVVRLKDPLKQKALLKGLTQLSEEGATQVFKPLLSQDMVLGAVGSLQFDVVAHRLESEYHVHCAYEPAMASTVRWLDFSESTKEKAFCEQEMRYLAKDHGGNLCYLASSQVNLELTMERWPDVIFHNTREHHG